MSVESLPFPGYFDIQKIINYADECCQKRKTVNKARKAYLCSSLAEAKEGCKLTLETIATLPQAIAKLPLSFSYCVDSIVGKDFKYLNEKQIENSEKLKDCHKNTKGITDVLGTACKALYCFLNIFLSPLFGMIDPEFNTRCHIRFLGVERKGNLALNLTNQKSENVVYLEDLPGLEKVKEKIKIILEFLKNPKEAESFGVTFENILLHGLPGCGKTFFIKALANSVQKILGPSKVSFHIIDSATNGSTFIHGTTSKIQNMFDKIENEIKDGIFPILFIDEMDALFPKRDRGGLMDSYIAEEMNLYLTKIEHFAGKMLVVGGTNRPSSMDLAMTRTGRLGLHIFVEPPQPQDREKIIRFHLEKIKNSFLELKIDYEDLVKQTEGFSASDLKCLVQRASNKIYSIYREQGSCKILLIDNQFFDEILKEMNPQCTPSAVKEYKIANKSFFKGMNEY